jgi:hypothetical protein
MKKENLHNIKTTGFKTPEYYFESFDATILATLKNEQQLQNIKTAGFKTPENYFETFDEKLNQKLQNKQKSKVIRLWSWKNAAYTTAVAASLVLFFNLIGNTSDSTTFDDLETTSIVNYLSEEDLNTYDIASLLNEDDLVLDNFVSENISEESLENYLLNNTTIEDLIIDRK